MILAELPQALHVLCVAPQQLRALRLAERDGIGLEEAARRVSDSDRARHAFHRKFWKVEVDSATLYDLSIDTSRLSYEVAADLVATASRAKAGG